MPTQRWAPPCSVPINSVRTEDRHETGVDEQGTIRQRPVVDHQAADERGRADRESHQVTVELGADAAAGGVEGRAEHHRRADGAEHPDCGQQRPVEVDGQAILEHHWPPLAASGCAASATVVTGGSPRQRRSGQRKPLLLGEEGLDHVAGDRGGQIPMLPVLREDDAGDAGVVARGGEDEPPVIPQVQPRTPSRPCGRTATRPARYRSCRSRRVPARARAAPFPRTVDRRPESAPHRGDESRARVARPAAARTSSTSPRPARPGDDGRSTRGVRTCPSVRYRRHHHGHRQRRHGHLRPVRWRPRSSRRHTSARRARRASTPGTGSVPAPRAAGRCRSFSPGRARWPTCESDRCRATAPACRSRCCTTAPTHCVMSTLPCVVWHAKNRR